MMSRRLCGTAPQEGAEFSSLGVSSFVLFILSLSNLQTKQKHFSLSPSPQCSNLEATCEGGRASGEGVGVLGFQEELRVNTEGICSGRGIYLGFIPDPDSLSLA